MGILTLLGRAVIVFALLGLTLYAIRRTDRGRRLHRTETPVQVLGSTKLGKGASVALVRIGDTAYALGVTEHAVTLLTPAELPAAPAAEPAPAPDAAADPRPTFAAALQKQVAVLLRTSAGAEPPRTVPDSPDAPAESRVLDLDAAPSRRTASTRRPATRTSPARAGAVTTTDSLLRATSRTDADGSAAGTPPRNGGTRRRDAHLESAMEPACPPSRPARRSTSGPGARARG